MKKKTISPERVYTFVEDIFGESLHQKRVLSISNAVTGCLNAVKLAIHAIGIGMAEAKGLVDKHAIKQFDRLLSNNGIDVWRLFEVWVRFIIGNRPSIVVTMDWTDFDKDNQTTIAINMVTNHGRATPLLWRTVEKRTLKKHRNQYEDELLIRLRQIVPEQVGVVVLADRGFGDTKLYNFLKQLGFGYIIRFKQNILVVDENGTAKMAGEWVLKNGKAVKIINARVTQKGVLVPAVVIVWARGMKEPWCLTTSEVDMSAEIVVAHYGKRFTTEESFRDTKDIHFGMGLTNTHIGSPERRDRMLLINAISTVFLTILGTAGEENGLDAKFRANTVKRRTHSLFRQGCMYFGALPTMRDEWAIPLLDKFESLLREHPATTVVMGSI
jgi:hypothetical protein